MYQTDPSPWSNGSSLSRPDWLTLVLPDTLSGSGPAERLRPREVVIGRRMQLGNGEPEGALVSFKAGDGDAVGHAFAPR